MEANKAKSKERRLPASYELVVVKVRAYGEFVASPSSFALTSEPLRTTFPALFAPIGPDAYGNVSFSVKKVRRVLQNDDRPAQHAVSHMENVVASRGLTSTCCAHAARENASTSVMSTPLSQIRLLPNPEGQLDDS